jgi:ABC-2 type transport system permease protein
MLKGLPAIFTNSFTETIRQPIYGVVIGITILILLFSPSLSMFTMDDDSLLLRDVGLSTLLVAGLFIAVFAAATVITEEIENKTVLTVLSKTISRSTFILGKFLGISSAVLLAIYFLSLVLLMLIRNGVPETARYESDKVVVVLGIVCIALTLLVCMGGNYFYHWRFSTTFVLTGTLLTTLSIAIMLFLDPHWSYNPQENHIPTELIGPIVLTAIAVLILTSIAIAVATRLGLVMTLSICSLIFILGVMLQHLLGPIVQTDTGITRYLAWTALAIVPSLHFYTVTNAIYSSTAVPLDYIANTALYALFYITAALLMAIALFRSREVG